MMPAIPYYRYKPVFDELRPVLEAALRHGRVPDDSVMQEDVKAHAMAPIFDGGALERI